MSSLLPFDPGEIPAPCFVVSADRLRENGRILDRVRKESGATVLLALKAFSMPSAFLVLRPYLNGTTASSIAEALLAKLHFGGEVHAYAVAYQEREIDRICSVADHVVFNSLTQWKDLQPHIRKHPEVQYGLRINPQYSEVEVDIYNPCRPDSRFGMTHTDLMGQDLTGISGLHFHTLCEQGLGPLVRTLEAVERDFSSWLHQIKWLNLGGGHFITKPDYDVDGLIDLIKRLRDTYALEIILEPGEAVVQESGWLVATVLDVFTSQGIHHAILNVSATAHMPDVLEMPYRPEILNTGRPGEKAFDVMLGGVTCLSGDRIGNYSFDSMPKRGDRLVFTDMAMYTMVKTSHFNGVPHPSIGLWDNDHLTLQKTFGYADVRNRLG